MATSDLDIIRQQAGKLPLQDQLTLLAYLSENVRRTYEATAPRRKWRELAGIAPNLMQGDDAQEWVSRSRQEADSQRENKLNR